jgi:RNA polymerase sigma factor (sigma-70 family)
MTTLQAENPLAANFVTTRWTQVLKARGQSPEARIALGQLCEAYWTPIFRFIRQSGHNEDTARDLTQEFVAQLLAKHGFDGFEPSKGRFRSYLLGAVKHFLSDQRDRARSAKRGGGEVPLPLEETGETSTSMQIPDPSGELPETFFDRQWALNLIERALGELAKECATAGKKEQYEVLKPWLVGDAEAGLQVEAARRIGFSEGALKVAIHRLRKRFRALVKAEIAQTVESPEEIQAELHYLVEVLSR